MRISGDLTRPRRGVAERNFAIPFAAKGGSERGSRDVNKVGVLMTLPLGLSLNCKLLLGSRFSAKEKTIHHNARGLCASSGDEIGARLSIRERRGVFCPDIKLVFSVVRGTSPKIHVTVCQLAEVFGRALGVLGIA